MQWQQQHNELWIDTCYGTLEVDTGCWGHLGMRENHKEDKPIHSAVELLARTDYVSAAQQVFLNLLQVPQIHLRATNLRVHRSEQDWGAAQHRRAVLRTLLLTTCMIFKTIWLLFALCCGVGIWLCGGVSWCHLAALQKQNSVNDKEALYVKPGWLF